MRGNIETYIVDAFTSEPFHGNPAGVCLLKNALPSSQMLSIAQELNLSETAFVLKNDDLPHFPIRYFSPKMEIPLCGHATLASAKVLFQNTEIDQIQFKTKQGIRLDMLKKEERISMRFPSYGLEPNAVPEPLLQALGLDSIVNSMFNRETKIILIEIDDPQKLETLSPNYSALILSHSNINGVLVTAPSSNDQFDFHSRYFWPWSGSNEDPVTGGTHTFLAPYWSKKLKKRTLHSYQSSKRGGSMTIDIIDDSLIEITSSAVIVFKGILII